MNNDIIRRGGALHDMRSEDEHISAVLADKETILLGTVKELWLSCHLEYDTEEEYLGYDYDANDEDDAL